MSFSHREGLWLLLLQIKLLKFIGSLLSVHVNLMLVYEKI